MTSEKTIYGYCECKSKKEVQKKLSTETISLSASGWSDNTQTVSCSIVTADNIVWVSPATASFDAYGKAGIRATAQGDGTLTFTCTTVPTEDMTVEVVA